MEPIMYIFLALVSILPFAILALYVYNSDQGKSSWGGTLGIIICFLVIMAFLYAILVESDSPRYLLKRIYIALTAFLPAIMYIYYIIAIDEYKPEPFRVILITVFLGVVAAFSVTALGMPLFLSGINSEITHNLYDSLTIGFFKIAIPSELAKWLFLFVFLQLNKYYDEYLDGVVYSVCLAMGFASVLGILFMSDFVSFSFYTFVRKGIVTALILIPIHLMTGAIMGYFFAIARKGKKFINYTTALVSSLLVDGVICTMLAIMGSNWGYYFITGGVLLFISLIVYHQIRHLLTLDLPSNS